MDGFHLGGNILHRPFPHVLNLRQPNAVERVDQVPPASFCLHQSHFQPNAMH